MFEWVVMIIYNGMYFDVFWYYYLIMDGGMCVMIIDEVLLEWCMGCGVKLDFCVLFDGYVVIE